MVYMSLIAPLQSDSSVRSVCKVLLITARPLFWARAAYQLPGVGGFIYRKSRFASMAGTHGCEETVLFNDLEADSRVGPVNQGVSLSMVISVMLGSSDFRRSVSRRTRSCRSESD